MCGISLIIDKTCALKSGNISQMSHKIAHRGQDFTGFFQDKITDEINDENINYQVDYQIFMAHNRLKIQTTNDNANQPFFSEDKNFILLYNGELYNYEEIALNLDFFQTKQNKTNADTEVFLYALLDFLDKKTQKIPLEISLNGIFAFVLYDKTNHKIYFGRDRFGTKPLYFFKNENYFILSSEIKGILASNLVEKKLKKDQILNYLTYGYAQYPNTFFEDIFEVQKGEITCFDIKNDVFEDFFEPFFVSSQTTNGLLVKTQATAEYNGGNLENILLESLQKQLQADAKIGIFLSGGVDSTLLLALTKQLNICVDTFSIVFEENSKNNQNETKKISQNILEDSFFAKKAAIQYQNNNQKNQTSTHHEVKISDDILNEFQKYITLLDMPIADGAGLLTHALARHTQAQNVRVVLSGAGADELFGGYNRHWAFVKYLKNRNKIIFKIGFKLLKTLKKPFLSVLSMFSKQKQRLAKQFLENINEDAKTTFLQFSSLNILQKNQEKNQEKPAQKPIQNAFSSANFGILDALKYDQNNYLSSDVLAITDLMTMRHSVEARVPFLDEKVVQFVQNIPKKAFLENPPKWLLKEILNKKNGKIYTQRTKQGFGMPFGEWIKMEKWQHLLVPLLEENSSANAILNEFVSVKKIKEIVTQHLNNEQDNGREIWALLVLVHWLKLHS